MSQLLVLRVEAEGAPAVESYMNFEDAKSNPGLLMRQVEYNAADLLPGALQIRATYADEEGDNCSLTESTVPDALTFAAGLSDGNRVLRVRIQDPIAASLAAPKFEAMPMEAAAGSSGDAPQSQRQHGLFFGPHSATAMVVCVKAGAFDEQKLFDIQESLDDPSVVLHFIEVSSRRLMPGKSVVATCLDSTFRCVEVDVATLTEAIGAVISQNDHRPCWLNIEVRVRERPAPFEGWPLVDPEAEPLLPERSDEDRSERGEARGAEAEPCRIRVPDEQEPLLPKSPREAMGASSSGPFWPSLFEPVAWPPPPVAVPVVAETQPLAAEETLPQPSANAYRVAVPTGREDEFKRQVQSQLNKIAPDNLATIAARIKDMVVSSEELELVIDLVMKRALTEPHFCETYADLVCRLKGEIPELPSPDCGRPASLKSTLLTDCQEWGRRGVGANKIVEAAAPPLEELVLRVQAVGDAGWVEDLMALETAKANPGALLRLVRDLARRALPVPFGTRTVCTYTDEEGDQCTLTEQTAEDAVECAAKAESGNMVLTILVRAAIDAPGATSAAEPAQAAKRHGEDNDEPAKRLALASDGAPAASAPPQPAAPPVRSFMRQPLAAMRADQDAERVEALQKELREALAQADEARKEAAGSEQKLADQDLLMRGFFLELEGERVKAQEATSALERERAEAAERSARDLLAAEERLTRSAEFAEAHEREIARLKLRLEDAEAKVNEAVEGALQKQAQVEREAQEAVAKAEKLAEERLEHTVHLLGTIGSLESRTKKAEDKAEAALNLCQATAKAKAEAEEEIARLKTQAVLGAEQSEMVLLELQEKASVAAEMAKAAKHSEQLAQQESAEAAGQVCRLEKLLQEVKDAEQEARQGTENVLGAAAQEARAAEEEKRRLEQTICALQESLSQTRASLDAAERRSEATASALEAARQSNTKCRVEMELLQKASAKDKAKMEMTLEHYKAQEAVRSWSPKMSATVVRSEALLLGVEADEDVAARGPIADTDLAAVGPMTLGARQAYRIGRVRFSVGSGGSVASEPVVCTAIVENDGKEPWPATAAIVHAAGDALDFPLMPLGAIQPGERAEVKMDLNVPQKAELGKASSVWLIRDATTSAPLGPALVFEMEWLA